MRVSSSHVYIYISLKDCLNSSALAVTLKAGLWSGPCS